MSHLSILPTALDDPERLQVVLQEQGYKVTRRTILFTLGSGQIPVEVLASKGSIRFGWRQLPGQQCLDLVTDLGNDAAQPFYQQQLSQIIRRYALHQAMTSIPGLQDQGYTVEAPQDFAVSR